MKRSRNNKETGCLIQLAYCNRVNHATRVTTLQLKQLYIELQKKACFTLLHYRDSEVENIYNSAYFCITDIHEPNFREKALMLKDCTQQVVANFFFFFFFTYTKQHYQQSSLLHACGQIRFKSASNHL